MRKIKIIVMFLVASLCTILIGSYPVIADIATEKMAKKNPDSYWSTKNAPLFYGATKITLELGSVNEFNIKDARFRIFAKDFEDGDLTPQITHNGNVNVNKEGTYNINYSVKDQHNNTTAITVPVIVKQPEDENSPKINVERTLYTLPSTWNMNLAGFSRCNSGDRQILGIYLGKNQSIKARAISAENNISVAFLANDSAKETAINIPSNGQWVTLSNIKNETPYDSVPVLTSNQLSKGNKDVNKTFKIELEFDSTINTLNYYHYQDDETAFRNKWKETKDTYGIIENEAVTVIVPLNDLDKTTNYHKKGFTSLDEFLEYYLKVVNKMDEYVGLDLNPEKITDQNVRTKYLVKANAHGGGAAYYAGNHVGINSPSVSAFFEMNWGGLHEFAHGYQGSLGKGEMQLGEVANNIIGHYIQIDKDIYFHSGDWLGSLPAIEESKNAGRLEGKSLTQVDVGTRLYMIVNLFDTFEGGDTYAKMFSWYREQLNNGKTMTNQDAYVLSLAELYQVNIIPYMEAWGLKISDPVKENVFSKNYPMLNILKDVTNDDTLNKVLSGENTKVKYGLVTNETLNKYNITSNLTLNIDIDNLDNIKGKNITIKQGNKIIKNAKITSGTVKINDLPIGTYYLQMPVNDNYSQNHAYVTIKEKEENTYTYTYTKLADINYNNYLTLEIRGWNYPTSIAYRLTFKDNYTKGTITYPNQSSMSGNEYVKIYDDKGNLIDEDNATNKYFNYNRGTQNLNFKPGYVIEVKYPSRFSSRVMVFSTLTNEEVKAYRPNNEIARYVITKDGLKLENMTEEEANEIAYTNLKTKLVSIIETYKAKVTDEELNNRLINFSEKSSVLSAYNQLRDEDKKPYTELINQIKRGGLPTVTTIGETKYPKDAIIDLYSLIEISDNEDGVIIPDKNSVKIDTNLDSKMPGIYTVNYTVTDTDKNSVKHTADITIEGSASDPANPDDGKDDENNPSDPTNPDDGKDDENNPSDPTNPDDGKDDENNPSDPTNPDDGKDDENIPSDPANPDDDKDNENKPSKEEIDKNENKPNNTSQNNSDIVANVVSVPNTALDVSKTKIISGIIITSLGGFVILRRKFTL